MGVDKDIVDGGDGNDVFYVEGGDDVVFGGDGLDIIFG